MDERKDIAMIDYIIGITILFFWFFSFPFIFYAYLIIDRIEGAISTNKEISKIGTEDIDPAVWIFGVILSPIASIVVLAFAVGKLLSIFATLKANSYIRFNKKYGENSHDV